MKIKTTLKLSAAIALAMGTTVSANAISAYSQNFEGLATADSGADAAALSNDGWLVNGLVFDSANNFKFFYGNFPAPNGGPSFSAVATGQAGAAQGSNYLNAYSDYNCCALGDAVPEGHGNGTDRVESYLFQEQVVNAGDEGTWTMTYDLKLPDGTSIGANSTAQAFLRTLDPNAGYATSAIEILDSSDASDTNWATRSVSMTITAGQIGHIFQFGFFSTSQNFEDTGVYYDNINFAAQTSNPVPVPAAAWLFGSAIAGLAAAKRKKA